MCYSPMARTAHPAATTLKEQPLFPTLNSCGAFLECTGKIASLYLPIFYLDTTTRAIKENYFFGKAYQSS